jgi:hypothetical protein
VARLDRRAERDFHGGDDHRGTLRALRRALLEPVLGGPGGAEAKHQREQQQ